MTKRKGQRVFLFSWFVISCNWSVCNPLVTKIAVSRETFKCCLLLGQHLKSNISRLMNSGERSAAASSPTFEKPQLHAASHALSNESGHIVVFVDDTHLYGEALSLR